MQGSLFDSNLENNIAKNAPLADRIRPENLDEFSGQSHILGKGRQLYRMIAADRMSTIVLYGPPGTGKTTIANIIAKTTKSDFIKLNAVTSGVKDIKEVIDHAKNLLAVSSRKTILFIDEIHRFNKAQQDALLPSVENGILTLIGATTENPFFEVNKALISRATVFQLDPLTVDEISQVIDFALKNENRGLGSFPIVLTEDAKTFLSEAANGDARVALNALELAFLTTPKNSDGIILIDEEVSSDCIQKKIVKYDKDGDSHYDTISAFIKSLRGSDPDAALYWLAKMIFSGEDPKFIARRMIIFASEDISNADPYALLTAVSAFKAVEVIGLPECQLNLAHCATYLACCPKSNASMLGFFSALEDINKRPTAPVPAHLKSTGHSMQKSLGNGVGYKYPHDYPKHYVEQNYLPEDYNEKKYFIPSQNGYEKRLFEYLKWIKNDNKKD